MATPGNGLDRGNPSGPGEPPWTGGTRGALGEPGIVRNYPAQPGEVGGMELGFGSWLLGLWVLVTGIWVLALGFG